jgi:hypothetical protein
MPEMGADKPAGFWTKRKRRPCGSLQQRGMRPDLLAVVRAHPEIGFTIAVMGWPTDRGGRRRDPRQLELHHRSLVLHSSA